MKERPKPSPPARSRRPGALTLAALALGVILVLSIAWRLTGRGRAGSAEMRPSPAVQIPKSAAAGAERPAMPAAAEAPAPPVKAEPNVPVTWNGDYHKFFPLAPGNTWTFRGRNSRASENFEYTWHISQRVARPGGGTLYVVDLYRNGQYRDRFLFGSDESGTYRYDSPDGTPGPVILYPAVAGTGWSTGAHEIRVVGTTEVTTPAGRFPDAVKVRKQETGKPGDPVWTAAYEYFVPGVGRVESVTFSHHDGKTDTLRAQLAGFVVQSE